MSRGPKGRKPSRKRCILPAHSVVCWGGGSVMGARGLFRLCDSKIRKQPRTSNNEQSIDANPHTMNNEQHMNEVLMQNHVSKN
mmetsp:Transcript_31677/g.51459  ORF Transcript_31677/g.51459 Transcript_31677/m.51459 type:complete len:83 (-) Transcript_31677:35-283(-)